MQGKIHGMGLKLAPTDKHGFHFYISAPHPGTRQYIFFSLSDKPEKPLSGSVNRGILGIKMGFYQKTRKSA